MEPTKLSISAFRERVLNISLRYYLLFYIIYVPLNILMNLTSKTVQFLLFERLVLGKFH